MKTEETTKKGAQSLHACLGQSHANRKLTKVTEGIRVELSIISQEIRAKIQTSYIPLHQKTNQTIIIKVLLIKRIKASWQNCVLLDAIGFSYRFYWL